VAALLFARRGPGGGGVEPGGGVQVTGPLVEVRRHRGVPRDAVVHLGEGGQPGRGAVGLADRDRAVEPDDGVVGEPEELVVPRDDLRPVGLGIGPRVGVQGGDGGLRLELAEAVAGERRLQDRVPSGDSPWASASSPVPSSRFPKSSMNRMWALISSGVHWSMGAHSTTGVAPPP
jgi:hypothetical protein